MHILKKLLATGAVVLTIGLIAPTLMTQAAQTKIETPVEITANLTNRTIESILKEMWETGKSPVQIADEAGKLTDFEKETLAQQKKILNQRVKDGLMTQTQADNIINSIEESQTYGYGYGYGGCGYNYGGGYRRGYGYGGGCCGGYR